MNFLAMSRLTKEIFGTDRSYRGQKPYRGVDDVVDEGGVGDGVVPVEGLHRRVVDGLVRGDVDRGLPRPRGAAREVGVHAAPVVRAHGADVPSFQNCSLKNAAAEQSDKKQSRTRVARNRGSEAPSRTKTAFRLEPGIVPAQAHPGLKSLKVERQQTQMRTEHYGDNAEYVLQ
jgi:hypothetical protein